jgi:hypothetical protein
MVTLLGHVETYERGNMPRPAKPELKLAHGEPGFLAVAVG